MTLFKKITNLLLLWSIVKKVIWHFISKEKVKVNFRYNSKDNPDFLSVKQLIKMTKV